MSLLWDSQKEKTPSNAVVKDAELIDSKHLFYPRRLTGLCLVLTALIPRPGSIVASKFST
jgi:hypothetical protein